MINDLISRTAILEEMQSVRFDGIRDTEEWHDFYMAIRTAPVAYDYEKVIRKLKSKLYSEEEELSDWGFAHENGRVREAIEIVESGIPEN